jgi:hypothetical protein
MPTEVSSPVNRKGGKLSGNIPGSSPGAGSNPSRTRSDQAEPPAGPAARVSLSSDKPASLSRSPEPAAPTTDRRR